MQTAKTILLLDTNSNYISPATNIESLYYEASENNVIYRHSIYQHFPVYVNYGNVLQNEYIALNDDELKILDVSGDKSTIVDNTGKDIIISTFYNTKLKGTNYYALNVSNYNLSEILASYAGIAWAENNWKVVIKNLDSSLLNLSTYIDDIHKAIDTSIKELYQFVYIADNSINRLENEITGILDVTRIELLSLMNSSSLIGGKLYRMVYDPQEDKSADEWYDHKFYMYLLAVSKCSVSPNVQHCEAIDYTYFTANSKLETWQVTYDIKSNTVTRMIDNNNNDVCFDFKNKKFENDYYLFHHHMNNEDYSLYTSFVSNNTVNSSLLCFVYDEYGTVNGYIRNNYIGKNNSGSIFFNEYCDNNHIDESNVISLYVRSISNNTIGSYNGEITKDYDDDHLCDILYNTIGSNNTLIIFADESTSKYNKIGNFNTRIDMSGNYNTVLNNTDKVGFHNNPIGCMVGNYCLSCSISGEYIVISDMCKNITVNAAAHDIYIGPETDGKSITVTDSSACIMNQRIFSRSLI